MRPWCRSGAAVGVLLLAALPAVARAQAPEPVLLDLVIGRIASRTVPAWRIEGREGALIPLLTFYDLAEIRSRRADNGDVTALFQPGNVEVVVSPSRFQLTVGGAVRPLTTRDFLVREGELFLATNLLTGLLDLRWQLSWPDLTATVTNPDELPIARRLRREDMALARLFGDPALRADGVLRESPGPVEGLAADYSLLVPTDPGPDGGAYSVALGLNVLRGAFEVRAQNQGDVSDGDVRWDLSWTGVWRENRWLSQLRLGDGFTTGDRTRGVRGIAFGNVPFRRPALLGQLPFMGTLGPGWQFEAYRGGRLLAFDSVNALGQFSLDVPIQYGENPVDFIAYGPFGEVRRFNRTYRVLPGSIPRGRIEYGISGGWCRGEAPCDGTGNADLRYGLTTRWTLNAGMDQFWRDSLPDLFHPYVGFIGGITNALALEGEYVHDAVLRGQLRIEPSQHFLLAVEGNRFARGVQAPIFTPEGRLSQVTLFTQLRPIPGPRRNWYSFDASVDWIETETDRSTSIRAGASLQPGPIRFIPSLRWEERERAGSPRSTSLFYGMNLVALPIRSLGPVLSRMTARAGIEFRDPFEAVAANGFLSWQFGRHLRAEIGATWTEGRDPGLSLLFTADFPGVRAYTTAERTPDDTWRASQLVQGSLLYDAGYGRVAFNAGPSLEQAGAAGRVFLDLNENGRYEAGEYVLPDVSVTVGMHARRTDHRGEFRVWQLPPFDPAVVTVDTASLASPLWMPNYSAIRFEPLPNRFATLNVPILLGGMADGEVRRVMPDGREVPVPGSTVILRHQATGTVRELVTFTDGSFYALSLRSGEWEVFVDDRVQERLGAMAQPLRFTLRPLLDGDAASGLVIVLR